MRTRQALKLSSLLVVVGMLVAAGGTAGAGQPRPKGYGDGTLTIGQLAAQTGQLSSIAPSLTTPVTMAIDEINAAGGAIGKPVAYTLADDGSDPIAARYGLDSLLIQGKVDAIMGPTSSEAMLGILKHVRDTGVLVCSGSNTATDLSTADSGGYYFRTVPSDRFQGPALARLVLENGHKKIGILARDDTYGRGLDNAVKKALTKGGAKVVADVTYAPHATFFDTDVGKVADEKPDAVIVLGFARDGIEVVGTLMRQGLGPQQFPVYTADGMRTNEFAALADLNNPSVGAGVKGTSPAAAPAGAHNAFTEQFQATGIDPVFSAYYYDCTILTALAADKAKSDDPAKMKNAFAANTKGGHKCNTYADCKKLLAQGKTIQYEGASAAFPHMNKFGAFEPNAGAYDIWSFDTTGRDTAGPPDTQIRIG